MFVRLSQTVLTMFLLANWFACTLRCQFEGTDRVRGSTQVEITAQKGISDQDGPDSGICDWMASGGLEYSDASVPAPEFSSAPLVDFQHSAFSESLVSSAREPQAQCEQSQAPPELRASFHFVFRNALPARAPSFA